MPIDPVSINSSYRRNRRINLSFTVLTIGDMPEETGILTGMNEWSQKRNFLTRPTPLLKSVIILISKEELEKQNLF